jgi:TolB-like protein
MNAIKNSEAQRQASTESNGWRRRHLCGTVGALFCGLAWVTWAMAQEQPAASPAPATQPAGAKAAAPTTAPAEGLTVAVLDFAASSPGEPNLGPQISEALTALLSGTPGIRLVDRSTIARVLAEQELNLSGIVDTEQAVKVGKLVGARILVVGKAFPMGEKMFITAKLIGTETSLVDGVLVKGNLSADIGQLVVELSEKLTARLREVGPKLVAQDEAGKDPLPDLKAKLANLKKPKVAVVIPERHLSGQPVRRPDPAIETEIKLLLRECGFTVQDVKQNELEEFARTATQTEPGLWPRELAGVDYVIVGQGFSEFAARIGNLVSCAGRAEINVIARASGHVEYADRTTERGVDLSENIAAKTALQKAGRTLGLRTLTYFSQNLPKGEEAKPQ